MLMSTAPSSLASRTPRARSTSCPCPAYTRCWPPQAWSAAPGLSSCRRVTRSRPPRCLRRAGCRTSSGCEPRPKCSTMRRRSSLGTCIWPLCRATRSAPLSRWAPPRSPPPRRRFACQTRPRRRPNLSCCPKHPLGPAPLQPSPLARWAGWVAWVGLVWAVWAALAARTTDPRTLTRWCFSTTCLLASPSIATRCLCSSRPTCRSRFWAGPSS
mmetsp:Transcript_12595/g.40574  ORF Transcript_12595/g.40574 Transcript_12595/m.40574 type:complete len:213 (-) Transcript_12595:2858-3496(-)